MQYYFNETTILLNAKTDEMDETVPPTDTRYRKDLQFFEQGLIDEADAEKVEIEQQQRRQRAKMNKGEIPMFVGNFFREVAHPLIQNDELKHYEEKAVRYEFIEDEDKNYWSRRNRKDWKDLPNLWGPYD